MYVIQLSLVLYQQHALNNRAAMDFATIKSLTWTFAPFLLSYGYSYYRGLQAQARANAPSRRPVPTHVRTAIYVSGGVAVLYLMLSLPYFAPENVLTLSSSRLQTPSNVLWRRVAALRPNGELTARDELLRDRTLSLDSRCLYLAFGPNTMIDCPFCHPDDARSYFVYALPSVVLPHLGNIGHLGLSTSSMLTGKEGARWRMQTTLGAFLFAVLDVYSFYSYDHTRNARATRSEDLDLFFWRMRVVRGVGIAALQAGFAALLWVSATNRLFVTPYTAADRLDRVTRQLQTAAGKFGAAGIVQNAVARDGSLRQRFDEHWARDGLALRDVMADDQVLRAVRAARSSGRVNLDAVDRDARVCAEGLIGASQAQ